MAHTANFRNLYDYSPIHAYQAPGYRGSSSTSSFHPVHPPEARNTPRHIVEDAALAPALLNFARNYLQTNTAVPGPLLLSTLPRLAYMAHTTSDSTEYNVHHLFDDVAAYGNFFVEGADALPPGSVRLMVCPTRHGIRPDGRSVRQGATRVIHEYKGRRALDTHADGITRLATANNGMGTELIRSPNETGSRSIIFKLGSYMAIQNCPWAILFGMDYFFIFYLNKVRHGDDIYHHIHCSPQLPAFHNGQQQKNPNLFQAMTAMVLGEPSQALAQTFTPAVSVPIGQLYPTVKGEDYKQPAGPVTRKMATQVQNLKSITLSSPASVAPERTIVLNRYGTKTAHHDQSAHIFLKEEIGHGITGSASKALLQFEDGKQRHRHQHVVVKLVETRISTFHSEAKSYNKLQSKPFSPFFYGAFVGRDASGAEFGALVLEELPQTFVDEDEMTTQQRSQALGCLLQLHDAGIHHGDIASPCFALNNLGQVVIYDFSHSQFFRHCDINNCFEIKDARRILRLDE